MISKFMSKWNDPADYFHFRVSLFKSFGRVLAGMFLMMGALGLAGLCLILAEVLGVVEEF